MILDIVILIGIAAVILLIIAYMEESIAIDSLSLLFWIFLMGTVMDVEVQYVSSGVLTTEHVNNPAMAVICFGVIIFNIILLIKDISQRAVDAKFRL
jgi:hypothetical protein